VNYSTNKYLIRWSLKSREAGRVSLVEQILLTLLEHMGSPTILSGVGLYMKTLFPVAKKLRVVNVNIDVTVII
jgi:hypothetical protein